MSTYDNTIWQISIVQQLAVALVAITDSQTMQNFLSDVMTKKEISEISSRLEAARMLKGGEKYKDIISRTKLSSRTVARISDWIQNGTGGYDVVINQINDHHDHLSPARAE